MEECKAEAAPAVFKCTVCGFNISYAFNAVNANKQAADKWYQNTINDPTLVYYKLRSTLSV